MTPPGTFWGQEPTFISAPRQALHRTPHIVTVTAEGGCPGPKVQDGLTDQRSGGQGTEDVTEALAPEQGAKVIHAVANTSARGELVGQLSCDLDVGGPGGGEWDQPGKLHPILERKFTRSKTPLDRDAGCASFE